MEAAGRGPTTACVRWTTSFALTVLVVAAAALGASTSAAAATDADPSSSATAAGQCVGPCPGAVFAKGDGYGQIAAVTDERGVMSRRTCDLAPRGACSFDISDTATSVFFRPQARSDSVFQGWEECPSPVGADCYVPPGANVVLCAKFVLVGGDDTVPETACPPPSILFFKKGDGSGTVTLEGASGTDVCGTACASIVSKTFAPGEIVTMTASAASGSTFVAWEGCPAPAEGNACRFPLTEVEYICAVFVKVGSTRPADPSCPYYAPEPKSGPPKRGSKCTISGSAGADVIRGTPGSDVICGRGGSDVIHGFGGNDLVVGGSGNDRLAGGPGKDLLVGGPGNDILSGGRAADTLLGGRGGDTLYARDGARDVVNGGFGRDRARVDSVDIRRSIERRF